MIKPCVSLHTSYYNIPQIYIFNYYFLKESIFLFFLFFITVTPYSSEKTPIIIANLQISDYKLKILPTFSIHNSAFHILFYHFTSLPVPSSSFAQAKLRGNHFTNLPTLLFKSKTLCSMLYSLCFSLLSELLLCSHFP